MRCSRFRQYHNTQESRKIHVIDTLSVRYVFISHKTNGNFLHPKREFIIESVAVSGHIHDKSSKIISIVMKFAHRTILSISRSSSKVRVIR